MDRFKNVPGGMPLRLDDFDIIQDSNLMALKAILKALVDENPCIMSGIVVTENGNTVSTTEGYYFDGQEIFLVPSFNSIFDSQKILHIVEDFQDTEARVFKDGDSKNCWQLRKCQVAYSNPLPENPVRIDDLIRISTYRNQQIMTSLAATTKLTVTASVNYLSGFTAAATGSTIKVLSNGLDQKMIHAAFTSENTSGEIGVLPIGLRPTANLIGYFYAGDSLGVLKIKKDGSVWVMGASTSAINYITFQYNQFVEDTILYNLPTATGGN